MPNQPRVLATVKITSKDINGGNIAKQFSSVTNLLIDYNDGVVNVVDKTGSFYFSILTLTSFTYTITPGVTGVHAVVAS